MTLFKTEPQADQLIGRTLDGRYEVLARLGVGGVGVVYRARQTHLRRFVAIKVMHPDAAASPEWRRRFEREARALSALAHPNVVPVTDFGIDKGGAPYLVMELLQGKTLHELIQEGPLPLWRALDIARQTLRGLAFAHTKGIVHRDLKPANVFLQALPDQADHVRLLDFGMVKFLEGSSSRTMAESLTHVGVVFGTPAYMSPEQVKAGSVDVRADVYAAGVLLFELLAGRRPFAADDHEGYIVAHLTHPVPSLAKVHPDLASAPLFQQLIEKAMAKKPSARYKDAGAMLAALEAVIAKLPPAATAVGRAARRKSAPQASTARGVVWRFLRRAIVVVTLAGGLAAGATYLIRDAAKPAETAAAPATPPKKAAPVLPPRPVLPPPPPRQEPPPAPTAALTPPAPPPPTPAVPPPAPRAEPVVVAPPPAPEPPPPAKAKAQAPAESPAEPLSAARDPWRASPVPRALKPIRDRVVRGAKMSQKALKPVYAFARENPDDPRPWLLLGRAYAELDWYTDSVERYVKAHNIDSASRGDPMMLADLLKGAAHPTAGRNAARAVRDIYGADALPALEKAISRAGNGEAGARLIRLRESLQR